MNEQIPGTVLIVDDDESTRKLIKAMLHREGYHLLEAPNGLEALEQARAHTPDLILMDVMMPQLNGFETCRRIREDPMMAEVPVLFITALSDQESRLRGIAAGADDFITKPINLTELRARVKTIMRLNRYRLLMERARFEHLVETSPDGILLTNTSGQIQFANTTACQMLTTSPENVHTQNIANFLPPNQAETLRQLLQQTIESIPQPGPFEFELKRPDGSSLPVEISLGPFSWHGERTVQLTVRDITERKRVEKAIRTIAHLTWLNELDHALSATLDPDRIVEIALKHIADFLDAPQGMMCVFPQDSGPGPGPTERLFTLQQGRLETPETSLFGESCWKTFLPQIPSQCAIVSFSAPPPFTEPGNATCLCGIVAPIRKEDVLWALLVLTGRPTARPFTEEDRALTETAIGRIGQAIQNAHLYQLSQQHANRLEVLNRVNAAAVSSLELDVVLQQILALTCEAVDAEASMIWIADPQAEKLTVVLALPDTLRSMQGYQIRLDEGIASRVVQNGQPICKSLVSSSENPDMCLNVLPEALPDIEVHSVCCVPLKQRKKTIGVIQLLNKRSGRFTEADLSLVESVSSIAAAAMENARLYSQMRAHANELALLYETGLTLTATLDIQKLLHASLSQIYHLLRADRIAIFQTDPLTNGLRLTYMLIEGEPVPLSECTPDEKSIVGWIARQRQSVLIPDLHQTPQFPPELRTSLESDARTVIAVPLVTREQITGVLEVISTEPDTYGPEELRFLQSIASIVAIALENAGLYDELKILLREWEAAQVQLIHAEKISALGRLIASVAHEINNPLQAIQTYLTLAQEKLDSIGKSERDESGEKEEARGWAQITRYLDTVSQEIERISAIIRRMRDFYRPAREGWRMTDIHALLESVLELTHKQLQHNHVTVKQYWDADLPSIPANPDHLKQVFLNLVLNAMEAMPDGGILVISTGVEHLQLDSQRGVQEVVRIEFSDTGQGIPADALSHLFEPFFTTKESGTGLGLSISYNIIQSHHGQINVESHVGLGTTFTIYLPTHTDQYNYGETTK